MKIDNLLITIYNYNKDFNAMFLNDNFKKYCKNVFVFDTFHTDEGTNALTESENVIYYPNIFLGGLRYKSYYMAKALGCEWVLEICSDVTFTEESVYQFCRLLQDNILSSKDIGCYAVSATEGSSCFGTTTVNDANKHLFNLGTNSVRDVDTMEDWTWLMRMSVAEPVYSSINEADCVYGWGIGEACVLLSRQMGLRTVIDDRVSAFHPCGTEYNVDAAMEEWRKIRTMFPSIGIVQGGTDDKKELVYNKAYVNGNTKYILFHSPKYESNVGGVDEFLKNKTFLSICPNDKSEYYTDLYNDHHFTNKFTYRVAKSVLGFMGIGFNAEDFVMVENIENGEDFSYLKNIKDYDYEVTSDFYVMPNEKNGFVSIYENHRRETCKIEQLLNQEVENRETLNSIAYPVHTAYHKLFKFSHQCCHIRNLNVHNGKKILISCDSYMVPYIPLIIPYCEEVTVLDNRFLSYRYHHFKTYEYTDVIVALSYCNSINKYINNNF